ncbi:hypothetical protein HALLA_10215 [Halostagnicola larsenii XH-48]|uniref:ArsR family transcriptional regulator n=1 Tax=Halostagnicola larsenii XH-48 TaxID=797299 RepID=W0JQ91_9EURY|nr:hypothetical protein [Halostagnicola larsenii]AHF99167.1 hypothetical protein HALLA_10215 [Halostagnicola larsenii XH-48]
MPAPPCQEENGIVEQWDRIFGALSAEPRRRLLVSLLDARPEEYVNLPEAALLKEIDRDERKLRSQLVHCHLPLLADYDFVRWRTNPFQVRRGPKFEAIEAVLTTLLDRAEEDPPLVAGSSRLEYDSDCRTE